MCWYLFSCLKMFKKDIFLATVFCAHFSHCLRFHLSLILRLLHPSLSLTRQSPSPVLESYLMGALPLFA